MEEYAPGPDGQPPRLPDPDGRRRARRSRCILVEDPEPLGPFGAKGVGEPALVPTAPAILAAIRHATGARIDAMRRRRRPVRAAILATRAGRAAPGASHRRDAEAAAS